MIDIKFIIGYNYGVGTVEKFKRGGKSLSINVAILALEGIDAALNFYYSKSPNTAIYVGNVLSLDIPKDPFKRSQIKTLQIKGIILI